MSKQHTTASGGGISFCGVLAIVFIVLKLLKVIDWAWLWVLAPIWIPLALYIVGLVGYLLVVVIVGLITRAKDRRRLEQTKKNVLKTFFDDNE